MESRAASALTLAFLLLFQPGVYAQSPSSSSITATANVSCPFSISINASPSLNTNHTYYLRYGTIQINYTLRPLVNCSTGMVNGRFDLNDAHNATLSSSPLSVNDINLSSSDHVYGITLNASKLENATYLAWILLSNPYASNSSHVSLTLFNPAQIVVAGFSAKPSSMSMGSSPMLYLNLTNEGQLTGNIMSINVSITGPQSASYSIPYSTLLISPQQSELVVFPASIPDTIAGTYNAIVTIHYSTAAFGKTILNTSTSATASYLIIPPPPSPPTKPVVAPITSTPQFGVVTAPLLSTVTAGSTAISQLQLDNSANATETLYISYPSLFSSFVSLSANSIMLNPKESASIAIAVHPNANVTPGSYVVPINVTAKIGNSTTAQTEFITISVEKQVNAPYVSQELTLTNSTNSASGIVEIKAPQDKPLSNATLETMIPIGLAKSISQISAYGLPNNMSASDGYYMIRWHVAYLPAGQVTYAYYTINKPASQLLLQLVQNLLAIPSPVPPQSKLKVLDISIPTFYANSANNVTVEMLYTGTSVQQISSILTGPPGISISPYQSIANATPNTVVAQRFRVAIGNTTGTALLSLYISTQGFNATYTLPIVMFAKPVSTTTTIVTTVPQQRIALPSSAIPAAITAIILIFAISVLIAVKSKANKARYTPSRAEKLVRLREQIRRSEE